LVAGYVYGAHRGLLQNLGIEPGPSAIEYLEKSYQLIFDTPVQGRRMLAHAFGLRGNEDFDVGDEIGGDDVFEWLRTGRPTLRLAQQLNGQPGAALI
jgi:hypothetical protein